MFRDRAVFKALLDDFTAYLLHGSHGTLGSIKTRQTTDTSTYFPLLNPLILVQARVLREIQPLSMPTHVSLSPSPALASLWGRQICPRSKLSAPRAHARHSGQGFTTRGCETAGLRWHQPQQVPFSSSGNEAMTAGAHGTFGKTSCKCRALRRAACSSSASCLCCPAGITQ